MNDIMKSTLQKTVTMLFSMYRENQHNKKDTAEIEWQIMELTWSVNKVFGVVLFDIIEDEEEMECFEEIIIHFKNRHNL